MSDALEVEHVHGPSVALQVWPHIVQSKIRHARRRRDFDLVEASGVERIVSRRPWPGFTGRPSGRRRRFPLLSRVPVPSCGIRARRPIPGRELTESLHLWRSNRARPPLRPAPAVRLVAVLKGRASSGPRRERTVMDGWRAFGEGRRPLLLLIRSHSATPSQAITDPPIRRAKVS